MIRSGRPFGRENEENERVLLLPILAFRTPWSRKLVRRARVRRGPARRLPAPVGGAGRGGVSARVYAVAKVKKPPPPPPPL